MPSLWETIAKSWRTQPRVPAGSPRGGQWRGKGGGIGGFVPLTGVMGLSREQRLFDALRGGTISTPATDEQLIAAGLKKPKREPKPISEQEQREGVITYTGLAYRPINDYLRKGTKAEENPNALYNKEVDTTAKVRQKIKAIDAYLENNRLKEPITVYRGSKAANLDKLVPGARITDKGLVSTTLNKGITSGFASSGGEGRKPAFFRIRLPAGAKASDISSFSYHPHEKEVLVARGSVFRVVSRDSPSPSGVPRYTLEYVAEGGKAVVLKNEEKDATGGDRGDRFVWEEGDIVITPPPKEKPARVPLFKRLWGKKKGS